MKKSQTVKRRIFLSNTLMVLITLSIFLVINVVFLEFYFHSIEQEIILTAGQTISTGGLEDLIENRILFLIDGTVCIFILLLVSQLFTKNLTAHIMKPLEILSNATQKIKDGDLSCQIEYTGEKEFEDICNTFNEMQIHLLKAQKRNQKYEKARTDMIVGISHDLKTPLTVIKGAVKGILDGIVTDSKQQRNLLQMAYRRSEDMDSLLNQLFYLSKLNTGNMPIHLKSINIAKYLETYANAIQPLLKVGEEEFIIQKNAVFENVLIDVEQFHRILDNLLTNSRKYAHKIPLKMGITLNKINEMIDICFYDNGVGVAKDKIPYIFDEFYRGDESRNEEGNGLGLYITKCLIEMMNGYVKAENVEGFKVHLILPILQKGKDKNEE